MATIRTIAVKMKRLKLSLEREFHRSPHRNQIAPVMTPLQVSIICIHPHCVWVVGRHVPVLLLR